MSDEKKLPPNQLAKPEESTKSELGIVQEKDGSYTLKQVDVPVEPWRVGVTEDGWDVYAPVKGPNADKMLHLRGECWVCRVCRCTVHKRHAVVDFNGHVYHRSCHSKAMADPELQKQIKAREAEAIRALKGKE